MRVLLVDDEPLVRRGLRSMLASDAAVEIVGECRNGLEALEAIEQQAPDVVFLDVQMPGLDGLGVVDALPPGRRPAIVFVTAFDAYAIRAFDLHAVDYLLKPFDEPRLRTALERVRARLGRPAADAESRLAALLEELRPGEHPERLLIRGPGRISLVPTAEIDWIEAADNYVRVHAGGTRHVLRETLKRLEERLDPRRFVRIHRSAIVNVERIRELRPLPGGEYRVVLRGGEQLTLSRGFRDAFERRLGPL